MESSEEFKLNTVVWARLEGFPWWPGVVVAPETQLFGAPERGRPKKKTQNEANKRTVHFFADGTLCAVEVENLRVFHLHRSLQTRRGRYARAIATATRAANIWLTKRVKIPIPGGENVSVEYADVGAIPSKLIVEEEEGKSMMEEEGNAVGESQNDESPGLPGRPRSLLNKSADKYMDEETVSRPGERDKNIEMRDDAMKGDGVMETKNNETEIGTESNQKALESEIQTEAHTDDEEERVFKLQSKLKKMEEEKARLEKELSSHLVANDYAGETRSSKRRRSK